MGTMARESISAFAFALFPNIVWETIIDHLQDSQDILNLFRVYPELELDKCVMNNLPLWLFDQIIPYLHSLPDNLSCRQVCKRWTLVVESYLDTDPRYRAYSHEASQIRQSQRFNLQGGHDTIRNSPWKKHFNSPEHFVSFKRNMTHFHSRRNPFVTRPKICLHDGSCSKSKYEYWTAAMEFLLEFGQHIWFLEIGIGSVSPNETCQHRLLRILSLVGNLKGLTIHCSDEWPQVSSQFKAAEEIPPALPQLESLKIIRIPEPFINFLLSAYSNQIRKLKVSHNIFPWGWTYPTPFPNLTEFAADYLDLPFVGDVLASLKASKLHSLNLEVDPRNCIEPFPESKIITWLSKFHLINSLDFNLGSDCYFPEGTENRSTGERESIPSLTSLTIRGPYVGEFDYGFLQHFPSLKYFTLEQE